jgi:transposase-like protein
VDWKRIKAEYIAGGTSYRKLCEKYGVSRTTLQRKAKDEKWLELRSQAEAKTETKIIETISTNDAKKAVDIIDVADKLLGKIDKLMDTMVVDTQSFKQLTSALKDLKEIKGYKSQADMREQEARIKKLEMEAAYREEDDDKPSGVVLMPAISEEIKPPIKEESNG